MIFLGQASNYRFRAAWHHLWMHGGQQEAERLKQDLAKKYQADEDQVEVYHTGRTALAVALKAVAKPGMAVIVPGLTCIAVVRAVRAAGCVPAYVDIEPEGLGYDWKSLDKKLKVCYNGSIILVQNTLGRALDMRKLEEIAKKHKSIIVEDLAHCAGRFYPDGREVGTVGAAAALSFGKGKALDTISGGAVVVRQGEILDDDRPTRRPSRGDRWRDRWYPILGWLMRGACHIGLGKIVTGGFLKLGWIARSADAELDTQVGLTGGQAKLAREQLRNLPKGLLREYYYVRDRAELLPSLARRGYHLQEIWYDAPVSPARYADEAEFPAEECPQTIWAAEHIINLPTWYEEAKLQPVREMIKPCLVEPKAIPGSLTEQPKTHETSTSHKHQHGQSPSKQEEEKKS